MAQKIQKKTSKEYEQIKGKEIRITHDNFGGAFDSVGINRFPGGPGLSHEKEEEEENSP